MKDLISRQMLLEYIHGEPVGKLLCDKYNLDGLIEQFPSAQPNLQPTCNQLATDCISRQPEKRTEKRTETHACDLISRQEAIDAVKDRYYKYGRNAKVQELVWSIEALPSAQLKSYREGYQAGFKDAQLEQPWIPCSESLPEDEQPILFSTTTGRVHQGRFHRDNSVNRWYSSLDKMRAYNNVVNAWMPLPEPYKEDDHD